MTWTDIINTGLDEAEKGGFEYDRNGIHWGQMTTGRGYYKLIFQHDFMSAVFGTGEHYDRLFELEKQTAETEGREMETEFLPLPLYKKMLQQMAIADDPLLWLEGAMANKANLENIGEGVIEGTKDTSSIRERLKQQFNPDA